MESCKVGKVKKVYKISHQELEFEFTNQTFFLTKPFPIQYRMKKLKKDTARYGQNWWKKPVSCTLIHTKK